MYCVYYRCQGDMRKPTGPLVYTIFSSIIIATFIANIIFYLGVWIVIKRTTHQLQVCFSILGFYHALSCHKNYFILSVQINSRLIFLGLNICTDIYYRPQQ